MVGDLAHSGKRANPGTGRIDRNAAHAGNMGDVDDCVRLAHPAFGEIEQRRAAGKDHRAGLLRRLAGFGRRCGAQIGKVSHHATSAAWRTAATMLL